MSKILKIEELQSILEDMLTNEYNDMFESEELFLHYLINIEEKISKTCIFYDIFLSYLLFGNDFINNCINILKSKKELIYKQLKDDLKTMLIVELFMCPSLSLCNKVMRSGIKLFIDKGFFDSDQFEDFVKNDLNKIDDILSKNKEYILEDNSEFIKDGHFWWSK